MKRCVEKIQEVMSGVMTGLLLLVLVLSFVTQHGPKSPRRSLPGVRSLFAFTIAAHRLNNFIPSFFSS